MSLKHLSTAVRVFCSFAESEILTNPATAWSDEKAIEAVKRSPRGASLAGELEKMSIAERQTVLRYAGSLEPLSPRGEILKFPSAEAAKTFAEQVEGLGHTERFNDFVVHVRDQDYALATRTAEAGGGAVVSDVIKDDFEKLDLALPNDMLTAGLPVELVEKSILAAIEARQNLTEGLVALTCAGPEEAFRGRLESFVRPRAKVHGVDESMVLALYNAKMIPSVHRATIAKSLKLEADASVGSVPPDQSTAKGAPPDRGGIAKNQPDVSAGKVATSQDGPKAEPKAPTEIVPDQAKDPASGDVTLPDGTVVPQEVLKGALSKLLANLATQLEQGTVGGKPEKPKGDGATPAADPEAPKETPAAEKPSAAPGVAAPPSKTDTKAAAVAETKNAPPAPPKPPKPAKPEEPKDDAKPKDEYTDGKPRPFPAYSDQNKVQGGKAKTDETIAQLSMRARSLGAPFQDVAGATLDGTLAEFVQAFEAMSETSGPARAFISRKIAVLQREGKPPEQAKAIALDMARKAGYDVPPTKGENTLKGTGADAMRGKKETSSASLPMVESDTGLAITVASPSKFDAATFHDIAMGEGVIARAGKLLDGAVQERIQCLTFPKPTFNESKAREWVEAFRVGAKPQSRRPELAEKKEEPGEQEELAQGAQAFEEAGKSVAALKASAFQLVTRDLVQIEAICQAIGAKKSMRAVAKLRESFTELHEEIKKRLGDYAKVHDQFMAESKAPEPVSPEPLTMDQAAATGVPASAPAAPALGTSAPVVAAPTESRIDKVVAALSEDHALLDRIADGETYSEIAPSLALSAGTVLALNGGLTTRELVETHEKLRLVAEKRGARVYQITLSEADRVLLSQVSESGGDCANLYHGTKDGATAPFAESQLERVVETLQYYGEVEHRLLADQFLKAMGRQAATV